MIAHPSTLTCQWPFGCERMAQGYDHDYITDQVRAALCVGHNTALGVCGDQPDRLRELAAWLEGASLGFLYSEYAHESKVARDHATHVRRYSDPEYRRRKIAYSAAYKAARSTLCS